VRDIDLADCELVTVVKDNWFNDEPCQRVKPNLNFGSFPENFPAMPKKKAKRKLSRPMLPMQRHLALQDEGRYFDLRALFDRLNARHFRGRLRGYSVVWGRRRRQRPKEYFVFGSIQEEDRIIRIHPLLDQPFVPRWFLEYILYHEMLHSVVPEEVDAAGRRRVHTEEFYRREKAFPRYRRARQWEAENLARFLR
jgi:hypothetical protein